MAREVWVSEYGATGRGRADETRAFERALNSGADVVRVGEGEFRIKSLRILRPVEIRGEPGSVLAHTSELPFLVVLASGVTLSGLEIREISAKGAAEGMVLHAGKQDLEDLRIENCRFTRWRGHGVYSTGKGAIRRISVRGCEFVGGAKGIRPGQAIPGAVALANGEVRDGSFLNNVVSQWAMGLSCGPFVRLEIRENRIEKILGQHAIYVAGSRGLEVSNNTIRDVSYVGIKMQHDANVEALYRGRGTREPFAIENNEITRIGQTGILATNASAKKAVWLERGAIVGNRIVGGADGVYVTNARDIVVHLNSVRGCIRSGLRGDDLERVEFADNVVFDAGFDGVNLSLGSFVEVRIANNRLIGCGRERQPGHENGIRIAGSSWRACAIEGNEIRDELGDMAFGISFASKAEEGFRVTDNRVFGARVARTRRGV